MSEPILTRLEHDIANIIHHHHASYHDHQQPAQAPQEGNMSILTEAVDGIKSGVEGVEGWLEDLKPHVEAIAAEATRIEANPATQAVIKAVEDAGLPDAWVNLAVDFIGKLGQLAAAPQPAVSPAAAEPAPQPA